jgi:hypothetical protein
MKGFDQYTPNQSTALLLVGSPGSGKTSLALQFPKPLYIFDADNNLDGPRRYLKENNIPLDGIKYDIGNVDDDGKEVKPFQRWQRMATCLKQAGEDDTIKTIVVDSLTAIQIYARDDIFRQRVGPQKMGQSSVMINDTNRDRGQLTEPEWGIFSRYFDTLVTALRSTGKIIIVTAHQETRQLNTGDEIWRQTIAVPGQTRTKLPGLFGDVWNVNAKLEGFGDKQKVVRFVRTIPTAESDERGLKSSFNLDPVEENPIEKVMKILNEDNNLQG